MGKDSVTSHKSLVSPLLVLSEGLIYFKKIQKRIFGTT